MQKYIERISQIDRLVRFRKTGTAKELANKLGISRSTLFETFEVMKAFGAEIAYCPHRQTYYYTQEGRFEIGFKPKNKLSEDEMEKITGGHKKYFAQSDIIGLLPFMFANVNQWDGNPSDGRWFALV